MSPIAKSLLLLFLFSTSVTFSQTIKGEVKNNDTKETLKGVHVTSSGIKDNTTTDARGEFTIHLKGNYSPTDSISFSAVGYLPMSLSLADLKAGHNEILLKPVMDELKEVNLNSTKTLNKKIRFTRLSSMVKGAYSFGSTMVGDKIYVVGGDASRVEEPLIQEMSRVSGERSLSEILFSAPADFSWTEYLEEIQVYDIPRDEWDVLSTPVSRRAGHNVIFYKDRIYIFGGIKFHRSRQKVFLADDIEILDLQKDTVVLDKVNPHQTVGAAAFEHGGDLLVMGGSLRIDERGIKTVTDDIHLFNLKSGLWFKAGKLLQKKETVGALVGDKFFLIGGYAGDWLKTVESLNLTTGKWQIEGKLPKDLKDPSVVSYGELIYIYERGKIHIFDTELRDIKTYDIDLDIHGPKLHVYQNQLYIVGGYSQFEYTKTPLSDCFKVDLREFERTQVLQRTSL